MASIQHDADDRLTGGAKQNMFPLADIITQRLSFVDTVHVFTKRGLSPKDLDVLSTKCRSVKVQTPKRVLHPWRRKYLLQGPSIDGFHFLKGKFRQDEILISRVDIALDLCTRSRIHAKTLHQFFRQHLTQRWPGQIERFEFKNTLYFRRAGAPRNFAIYGHRRSKVTTKWACHVERRYGRAAGCRRAGFVTLNNLINLDHRAFWSRELHLRVVDTSKLDKLIDQRVRQRKQRTKPTALRRQNKMVGTRWLHRDRKSVV